MGAWMQKHRMPIGFLSLGFEEIARPARTLALYFFIIVNVWMSVIGTVSATTVTPQPQYPTNLYVCRGLHWDSCESFSQLDEGTPAPLSEISARCLSHDVRGIDSHTGAMIIIGTMLFQSAPTYGKGAYVCIERMDVYNGWLYSAYYVLPYGDLVCPKNTVLDPTGYFCVTQDTLTITLSGGTEVEPSRDSTIKTLPIIATVIDQNTQQPPTSPVKVHVSLSVDPTSGGHAHGDSATRPRGGIAEVKTCASDSECWTSKESTDSNGQVVFNFNAPEASGKYTMTAICDGCSSSSAPKTVNVKVKEADAAGWDSLEASPSDYELIGGGEGKNHHDNHYLTESAQKNLLAIVRRYNKEYPAGPVLYLNDASLEWGGKFDISGTWVGAHVEHRRGKEIDIRANQEPTAISFWRFADFRSIAADNGASASVHCGFPKEYSWACWFDMRENRHFHVRLTGK